LATIVSQKVTRVTSHFFVITACAQNVLFHRESKRKTLTPLVNSRLNNLHFTR